MRRQGRFEFDGQWFVFGELKVLRQVVRLGEWQQIKEVSEACSLSPSMTSVRLVSLLRKGFLESKDIHVPRGTRKAYRCKDLQQAEALLKYFETNFEK